MILGEEKPLLDELAHFGVKGMHWGVRHEPDRAGYRLQAAGPAVDRGLPKATQISARNVSKLISERYGFKIAEVRGYGAEDPEYHAGTIGYVRPIPGKNGGVIHVSKDDIVPTLKHAEDVGWFGKGTGNINGFLTHESAHALFHTQEKVSLGFRGFKTIGGNIKARDKANDAAIKQGKKDGLSTHEFGAKISDYALHSGTRQEVEAELFSQYHWSPNPPKFVKVWGETLHQEMGIDPTPFRKVR